MICPWLAPSAHRPVWVRAVIWTALLVAQPGQGVCCSCVQLIKGKKKTQGLSAGAHHHGMQAMCSTTISICRAEGAASSMPLYEYWSPTVEHQNNVLKLHVRKWPIVNFIWAECLKAIPWETAYPVTQWCKQSSTSFQVNALKPFR